MHFCMTAIQNIFCVAVFFHRSVQNVQNFIWNIYPSAEIANQIWGGKLFPVNVQLLHGHIIKCLFWGVIFLCSDLVLWRICQRAILVNCKYWSRARRDWSSITESPWMLPWEHHVAFCRYDASLKYHLKPVGMKLCENSHGVFTSVCRKD